MGHPLDQVANILRQDLARLALRLDPERVGLLVRIDEVAAVATVARFFVGLAMEQLKEGLGKFQRVAARCAHNHIGMSQAAIRMAFADSLPNVWIVFQYAH